MRRKGPVPYRLRTDLGARGLVAAACGLVGMCVPSKDAWLADLRTIAYTAELYHGAGATAEEAFWAAFVAAVPLS